MSQNGQMHLNAARFKKCVCPIRYIMHFDPVIRDESRTKRNGIICKLSLVLVGVIMEGQ